MLDKGYGIMPNVVLFDTKISSTSKLVFCLISSLCAQEGYCWASNAYLSKQIHITDRQIRRCLQELKEYVKVVMITSEKRQISLVDNPLVGGLKRPGGRTKMSVGYDKNVRHNTITNNINIKGLNKKYKTISELGMPDLGGY